MPAARASRGPAGQNGDSSILISPSSGLVTPEIIFIKVLLPAPFSSTFVRHGDRHNADLVVIRQGYRLRIGRQVDSVSEQIRVRVIFVSAVSCMTMRGEPCQRRALNEAWRDSNHFTIWIGTSPRPLQLRGDIGRCSGWRRARRNDNFLCFPLAIVPLADEATPVLDQQIK